MRPAKGACQPLQALRTVQWHGDKGLQSLSKAKDPSGHAWHPHRWKHCQGSRAAIDAGAAPSRAGWWLSTQVGVKEGKAKGRYLNCLHLQDAK